MKTIFTNTEKTYLQLARTIEQRLRVGGEDVLPSYRSLAAEYNVTLNLVQRAFRELRKNGIVIPQQGKRVKAITLPENSRIMYRYGFIHPFTTEFSYGKSLAYYASEAFASPDFNVFVTVRSSGGDSQREREIAENMVYNGIQGILVSPADIEKNGDFFAELSRRIPIVLADQIFAGSTLPGVIMDYAGCGARIGKDLIRHADGGAALAIMDQELNRSARDCLQEIRNTAEKSGFRRLHIFQSPILQVSRASYRGDFSGIDRFRQQMAAFIPAHDIKVIFCQYDSFANAALLEDGWLEQFPQIRLILQSGSTLMPHSRHFFSPTVSRYEISYYELFRKAAELMSRWEHTRRKPRGITKIKFQPVQRRCSTKNGNNPNVLG